MSRDDQCDTTARFQECFPSLRDTGWDNPWYPVRKLIGEHDNLILSEIESKEAIYDSIKTFLGKGR